MTVTLYEPPELRIATVLERGVPNRECIALKIQQTTNLASFALLIGTVTSEGLVTPQRDHFFWLGNVMVMAGDWVFIYTGQGLPSMHKPPGSENTSYSAYWGKPTTLLANSALSPILIRMDAIQFPPPVVDLPQGARQNLLR